MVAAATVSSNDAPEQEKSTAWPELFVAAVVQFTLSPEASTVPQETNSDCVSTVIPLPLAHERVIDGSSAPAHEPSWTKYQIAV
jgi:hypothetical protein